MLDADRRRDHGRSTGRMAAVTDRNGAANSATGATTDGVSPTTVGSTTTPQSRLRPPPQPTFVPRPSLFR